MTAGHVEERHISEQCSLIGRIVLAQLWSQYFIDFFNKLPGKKSADDAAMRRQHAFGMAGGPGGVHDGCVVFRRNPKRIEVRFLQRFTAGYQVMNFRDGRFGSGRSHQYDVDAQLAEAGMYFLMAGGVGEDKPCPGVLEPIFKLWPGPPGIHGYNNRSEHCDRHIGKAPLWRIPATDSDAIPCLNAVLFLQLSRQFARGSEGFAKAVSRRFIDQEILIGVS